MCVTGGAGFIGSNLVDKLLENGHEVLVVDDLSLGKKENLQEHQNLVFVQKSICENIVEDVKGCEVMFHVAALPRVQYSIEHPLETNAINVDGTINVLDACVKTGIKRFVFSSSSSIYGDQEVSPQVETMWPNPMSPYALHKLTGEYYCKLFRLIHGLETVCFRYFNVYGPRQDPAGNYACLIPKFMKMIAEGKTPKINGDGKQTRDFVFVGDIVSANMAAATTDNASAFGDVFNVGSGKSFSVNEVASVINKVLGKNVEPVHGPAVIEPHDTLADIRKVKMALGWGPTISFEQGLEKTRKFFVGD